MHCSAASIILCLRTRGSIYGSDLLTSYPSRPLREDEVHARLVKDGYSLAAKITWVPDIPVGHDDGSMTLESWPVILPSSLVPCIQNSWGPNLV